MVAGQAQVVSSSVTKERPSAFIWAKSLPLKQLIRLDDEATVRSHPARVDLIGES